MMAAAFCDAIAALSALLSLLVRKVCSAAMLSDCVRRIVLLRCMEKMRAIVSLARLARRSVSAASMSLLSGAGGSASRTLRCACTCEVTQRFDKLLNNMMFRS